MVVGQDNLMFKNLLGKVSLRSIEVVPSLLASLRPFVVQGPCVKFHNQKLYRQYFSLYGARVTQSEITDIFKERT